MCAKGLGQHDTGEQLARAGDNARGVCRAQQATGEWLLAQGVEVCMQGVHAGGDCQGQQTSRLVLCEEGRRKFWLSGTMYSRGQATVVCSHIVRTHFFKCGRY